MSDFATVAQTCCAGGAETGTKSLREAETVGVGGASADGESETYGVGGGSADENRVEFSREWKRWKRKSKKGARVLLFVRLLVSRLRTPMAA